MEYKTFNVPEFHTTPSPQPMPKCIFVCMNCGDRLPKGKILFCYQGCSDAFQFKLDVGMLDWEM